MLTKEYNYNKDWRDKLLNSWPLLVDTKQVATLFSFAYCKQDNKWVWQARDSTSLFGNGTLFIRYTLSPMTGLVWSMATLGVIFLSTWFLLSFLYGLFVHVSWRETGNRRYIQAGFGTKLNGRLGLLFRIPKNDEKSSQGAHENAPNSGQATGWDCGTK